jgi:hypothetical protein
VAAGTVVVAGGGVATDGIRSFTSNDVLAGSVGLTLSLAMLVMAICAASQVSNAKGVGDWTRHLADLGRAILVISVHAAIMLAVLGGI